jgi:hypothetical protein
MLGGAENSVIVCGLLVWGDAKQLPKFEDSHHPLFLEAASRRMSFCTALSSALSSAMWHDPLEKNAWPSEFRMGRGMYEWEGATNERKQACNAMRARDRAHSAKAVARRVQRPPFFFFFFLELDDP